MKEDNIERIMICPKCGNSFHGYPAISRVDSITPICPDCGVREALSSMNISVEEQDSILEIIHRCSE